MVVSRDQGLDAGAVYRTSPPLVGSLFISSDERSHALMAVETSVLHE